MDSSAVRSPAHSFQRLTGKDNFFLAWISYFCWFVFNILYYIELYQKQTSAVYIVIRIIFYAVVFITIGFVILSIQLVMKRVNGSGGCQVRNPVEDDKWMRIGRVTNFLFVFICTGGFLLTSRIDLDFFRQVSFTAMMYWISCTPLPPGENTISKLLESAKHFFAHKAASEGSPG